LKSRDCHISKEILLLERRERRFAEIVLNRPAQRNALTFQMWKDLANLMDLLAKDEVFRVIVLRGAGDHAFSAGADISEFMSTRDSLENTRIYRDTVNAALRSIRTISKPVIAIIQGYALGGGCELAISADLRIASEDASFAIGAARLGVVISYRNVVRLIHTIGLSHSRKMLLLSKAFSAKEALDIGLVDYVVTAPEMETFTNKTVERLTEMSFFSLRAFKTMINEAEKTNADGDSYESIFDAFTSGYSQTTHFKEHVASFMKKERLEKKDVL